MLRPRRSRLVVVAGRSLEMWGRAQLTSGSAALSRGRWCKSVRQAGWLACERSSVRSLVGVSHSDWGQCHSSQSVGRWLLEAVFDQRTRRRSAASQASCRRTGQPCVGLRGSQHAHKRTRARTPSTARKRPACLALPCLVWPWAVECVCVRVRVCDARVGVRRRRRRRPERSVSAWGGRPCMSGQARHTHSLRGGRRGAGGRRRQAFATTVRF